MIRSLTVCGAGQHLTEIRPARDATGSRDPADHRAAVDRARQHGAEVVTSEMVLFEWLRDARHPRFRQVHKLLK